METLKGILSDLLACPPEGLGAPTRFLTFFNVPLSTTAGTLVGQFLKDKPYRRVDLTCLKYGFAVVEFFSTYDAYDVWQAGACVLFEGRHVLVDFAVQNVLHKDCAGSLLLVNLPHKFTDAALYQFCSTFGDIQFYEGVLPDERVVTYHSVEDATRALESIPQTKSTFFSTQSIHVSNYKRRLPFHKVAEKVFWTEEFSSELLAFPRVGLFAFILQAICSHKDVREEFVDPFCPRDQQAPASSHVSSHAVPRVSTLLPAHPPHPPPQQPPAEQHAEPEHAWEFNPIWSLKRTCPAPPSQYEHKRSPPQRPYGLGQTNAVRRSVYTPPEVKFKPLHPAAYAEKKDTKAVAVADDELKTGVESTTFTLPESEQTPDDVVVRGRSPLFDDVDDYAEDFVPQFISDNFDH